METKIKNTPKKISKSSTKLKREKSKTIQFHYLRKMLETIEQFNHNGKKTIAIFCDTFYPFVDGVISVMDNYAKRLQKEFNVVLCVPRHKEEYIEKEYPVLYFKSVYFKLINYGVGQPSSDLLFNKLLKSLHIDLIHLHSPFMVGRYGLREARKRDIPVIATFHSQYKKDFEKVVKSKPIVNMLVNYIMEVFNAVDEVWTMNEACKKTLVSYGYHKKVRLISNATDFKPATDVEKLSSLAREKYGIKDEENVYCFVGRLIVLKNILLICESLYLLKKKGVPFKMFFVGDGQDRQLLEEKIKELDLQNEVFLTGKIMDKEMIASIMQISSVMIFPSFYDNDPIVKYEASTYKTPTLFLKNSNSAFGIVDDETGFICDGKAEAIALKLENLHKNPQLVSKAGQGAFEQIYHHWDDITNKAIEVYKNYINLSEKQLVTKKQQKRTQRKLKKEEIVNVKIKKKIRGDLI